MLTFGLKENAARQVIFMFLELEEFYCKYDVDKFKGC